MGKFLLKAQPAHIMPVQQTFPANAAMPSSALMLSEEMMSSILGRALMRSDPKAEQAAKPSSAFSSSSFKIEDILSLNKEARCDRISSDSNSPSPVAEHSAFAGMLQNSLNGTKANFNVAHGLTDDKYSSASPVSPSSYCSPISSSMSSPYQQRIENPLAMKAPTANEFFLANGFPLAFGQFYTHLATASLMHQQQSPFINTLLDQIAMSQKNGLMPPFGLEFLKSSIMNELSLKAPAPELMAENQKPIYDDHNPALQSQREPSGDGHPSLNNADQPASGQKEEKKPKKKSAKDSDDQGPPKKKKGDKSLKSKTYGECDCAANCTELASK